jgi:hypothetical protein
MSGKQDCGKAAQNPPGIVIRPAAASPIQPKISAFIWGGKIRPMPVLPYGRRTAA